MDTQKAAVLIPKGSVSNMDEMVNILKSTFGKLGCPTCHSGIDISIRGMEEMFETSVRKTNVFVAGKGGSVKSVDEIM
jgi:hypothetical protein